MRSTKPGPFLAANCASFCIRCANAPSAGADTNVGWGSQLWKKPARSAIVSLRKPKILRWAKLLIGRRGSETFMPTSVQASKKKLNQKYLMDLNRQRSAVLIAYSSPDRKGQSRNVQTNLRDYFGVDFVNTVCQNSDWVISVSTKKSEGTTSFPQQVKLHSNGLTVLVGTGTGSSRSCNITQRI